MKVAVNWRTYWIAFQTLAGKEILRFLRIWIQTVLPAMVTTTLYFLIFGKIIGSRIGLMNGFSYLDYIVPGIILMAVITNSYSNTVSSFYQSKFGHYIEELLIAPVPNWIILSGFITGGVSRGLIVGLAVSLISVIFTNIHIHNYLISGIVLLLTATLFSLAGFINAIFAKSFDDVAIIPNFVLTPLTYLGGIFYSIQVLPNPWRILSFGNPIFYMVSAFRYGVLGVTDVDLRLAFLVILIFIIVLIAFSLWLLRHGVGIKS